MPTTDRLKTNAAHIVAFLSLCLVGAAANAQLSCTPSSARSDPGTGFIPFGAYEQALARGGNSGPAWEWAVGTDTESGRKVQGSLDWTSGKVYTWKVINSGTGSEVLEIRDAGTVVLSLAYPSGMDAGNALELAVSTNPSIGPETTIAASIASLNANEVSGAVSQAGTGTQSAQSLYYYFPPMAQGFTAEGTVSLTYPANLPSGSRVQFTVRAGTIPCTSSNTAPTVSISAPAANAVFNAPATISVTANAQDTDGTVTQVVFYANGIPIGTVTASPFTIQWANVQAGAYSLTAVATDNGGLTTTSAAVPVAVNAIKALYFIHPDHLNTPRLVADATGTTVWRWDQAEPFGSNPADQDPDGNSVAFDLPLRLPGQRYDKETNLHYNYFRDYDPSLGIYKQFDPIGLRGGVNGYAYALQSPLAHTDEDGQNPLAGVVAIVAVGAAGGALIDLGIKLITAGNDLEANNRLTEIANQLNTICQNNPGSGACTELANLSQTQNRCTASAARAQSKTVYNYLFDAVPKPPVSYPRTLRLP